MLQPHEPEQSSDDGLLTARTVVANGLNSGGFGYFNLAITGTKSADPGTLLARFTF